jgi:glycosyltransferase involved in cell wall biosynthesis
LAGNWPFSNTANVTNKDQIQFFTAQSLLQLLNESGWQLVVRNDFKQLQSEWHDQSSLLNSSTLAGDWLNTISDIFSPDSQVTEFVWLLKPGSRIIQSAKKINTLESPLLSILVRTQGKRNELLVEALYSVYAQDLDDYEVIICFHNNKEDRNNLLEQLKGILNNLPGALKSKLRLIISTGSGRSAPLNDLLEAATCHYLCFLDDDDLLFPYYVSTLKKGIEKYGMGPIFQTYAASRMVNVVGDTVKKEVADFTDKPSFILNLYAETFPYTVENISAKWVLPFDPIVQQYHNHVPITCYIFPRKLIEQTNQRFRPDFELGEDWEFLMRISQLLKVVTLPEITAAINIRTNQSNTVNNADLLPDWKFVLKRRLAAQVNQPLLLEGQAAQLLYYHHIEKLQQWKWEEAHYKEVQTELQTLLVEKQLRVLREDYVALEQWAHAMEKKILTAEGSLLYGLVNKILTILSINRPHALPSNKLNETKDALVYTLSHWEAKYPNLVGNSFLQELHQENEKYQNLKQWAVELDQNLRDLQTTVSYRFWQRLSWHKHG